jgi:hypothetical protein
LVTISSQLEFMVGLKNQSSSAKVLEIQHALKSSIQLLKDTVDDLLQDQDQVQLTQNIKHTSLYYHPSHNPVIVRWLDCNCDDFPKNDINSKTKSHHHRMFYLPDIIKMILSHHVTEKTVLLLSHEVKLPCTSEALHLAESEGLNLFVRQSIVETIFRHHNDQHALKWIQ